MASKNSFDVSTGVDLQEVDNAVNQATKEIQTRYDFKGTDCSINFDRDSGKLHLEADDEYRITQVLQILREKLAKRGVPLNTYEYTYAKPLINLFLFNLKIAKNNPKIKPKKRDADKSFKVTSVALSNLGKLVIINSKSINIPCYSFFLIY